MSSNYARYTDVFRDSSGNAVRSADIYVYIGDSSQLAALYDGAGNAVGQPLTTDAGGVVRNGAQDQNGIGFRAQGGRYRVRAVKDGNSFTLPDLLIGNAQGYDLADQAASPWLSSKVQIGPPSKHSP